MIESKVATKVGVPVLLIFIAIGMLAGIDKAQEIFYIVFFVVLFSTVIQGTTLPWVFKKLAEDEPIAE